MDILLNKMKLEFKSNIKVANSIKTLYKTNLTNSQPYYHTDNTTIARVLGFLGILAETKVMKLIKVLKLVKK